MKKIKIKLDDMEFRIIVKLLYEKHNELIVFDQLYGGASGDRYCTYGTATHPGVTVIYNNK